MQKQKQVPFPLSLPIVLQTMSLTSQAQQQAQEASQHTAVGRHAKAAVAYRNASMLYKKAAQLPNTDEVCFNCLNCSLSTAV